MLRNLEKLGIYTKYLSCINRCESTLVKSEKVKTKVKVSKRIKPVIERDVYQHFNTAERVAALQYPEELFVKKRNKIPENFYIADSQAAQIIIKELKKNLPKSKPILEVNPGIGLLTQLLIDETDNDLFLYEQEKKLFNIIADIISNYQNRKISLKQCDLIALWKMRFLDKIDDGNREDTVFDKIERKEYDDDTAGIMIASVGSIKFFRDLINSVIFQNGFLSVGRMEMLLCVPPTILCKIACSPSAGYFHYRATPILFQLLFEYEFIRKIDRKFFLPWRSTPANTPKLGKIMLYDFDHMYLIKVKPRQDLFKYCPLEHLTSLWFFVKQHLSSRSKTVIPTLERWIPGCGPRLIINTKKSQKPEILFPNSDMNGLPDFIAPSTTLSTNDFLKNIHIFTQFGMLTPTQILSIFNEFINWPDFESCAFSSSLEKTLLKMQLKEENDSLSDDEIEEPNKNAPE